MQNVSASGALDVGVSPVVDGQSFEAPNGSQRPLNLAPAGRTPRQDNQISLLGLLQVEGKRVLQFLSQDHSDPIVRPLAHGYSLRVSLAWFTALPEKRQQQILRDMDSEQTSLYSTPDPDYVDDLYPGFEGVSSCSESRGFQISLPDSGGDPFNLPNSGGDLLANIPNSGGEGEFWEVSSSGPPSVRAVGKVVLGEPNVEALAYEKLQGNKFDRSAVLEVVRRLWDEGTSNVSPRPFQSKSNETEPEAWQSGRWTAGAFVHGGVVGTTKSIRLYPRTTAFLCKALRNRADHQFASLTVLVNCHSEEHVDRHNDASCKNVAWNLSEGPQVGGIRFRNGELPLPEDAWASFWPRVHHSSSPCKGNKILLVGCTPRNLERLSQVDASVLEKSGFILPVDIAKSVSFASPSSSAAPFGKDEIVEEDEEWQVSLTCTSDSDCLIPFLRELYLRIHALKVHFGRQGVHMAEEGVHDPAHGPLLASIHAWSEDIEHQLQGEGRAWRP